MINCTNYITSDEKTKTEKKSNNKMAGNSNTIWNKSKQVTSKNETKSVKKSKTGEYFFNKIES